MVNTLTHFTIVFPSYIMVSIIAVSSLNTRYYIGVPADKRYMFQEFNVA